MRYATCNRALLKLSMWTCVTLVRSIQRMQKGKEITPAGKNEKEQEYEGDRGEAAAQRKAELMVGEKEILLRLLHETSEVKWRR